MGQAWNEKVIFAMTILTWSSEQFWIKTEKYNLQKRKTKKRSEILN